VVTSVGLERFVLDSLGTRHSGGPGLQVSSSREIPLT